MQIYSVVSEGKMFEEIVNDNDDDGCQVMAKAHMRYPLQKCSELPKPSYVAQNILKNDNTIKTTSIT